MDKNSGNRTLVNIVITFFSGLVLGILVLIHLWTNIFHYCAQLDADIASDALLATVIADNDFHTPDTWVSSTFKRVISAPNLGAYIYKLSGNMNLSMGIACSILMLLLVIVMALYYKQIGFKWNEVFSAIIILFSISDVFSENQSMLFLWAAYYVPYFISLYLMLIFYNKGIRKGNVPIWIWIVSLLLAFLNGMQGLHGCLYCYFPVLGVEILRRMFLWKNKRKDSWSLTVWLICTSVLSFGVTKLQGAYGLGASRNIRHAGEKFVNEVWPALGKVVYFGNAPAVVAVLCILAFVGYTYAIASIIRSGSNETDSDRSKQDIRNSDSKHWLLWGTIAPILSVIIYILSLTFTTMEVAPRYFIAELFVLANGVGLFINLFEPQNTKIRSSALVTVIVVILGLLSSKYYYNELIVGDRSSDSAEAQVATWMKDHGYEYGYAIFDNANTITVLTNNTVKVRSVNNMKDMEGCKWLTDTTWYPPTKSTEGETCYLVSESAREDFDAFLNERNPVIIDTCDVGRYTVYVLDHDYTVWVN